MEVADKVFGQGTTARTWDDRDRCDFEATLVVAAREVSGEYSLELESDATPLLKRYSNAIEGKDGSGQSSDWNQKHAREVTEMAMSHFKMARRQGGIGFKESVRRIELFSSGLRAESK